MKILDGKKVAAEIKDFVKFWVEPLKAEGESINLAVIQVGDDAASSTYIRNKQRACEYVGIESETYHFGDNVSQKEIVDLIEKLNQDNSVTGILVQLPLPKHLNEWDIVNKIDPKKDVDGFVAVNAGKLARNCSSYDYIAPCTPSGIISLLDYYGIELYDKHCVVVGRSNIVGRPMAELLLEENATVTICHSYTKNLKEICKSADILICAIGKPKFFTKDYIKDGAVVIDVGIHKMEDGKLCGDVDFDDVKDVVSAITPVPGGVGPLTVASLMNNCVVAWGLQCLEEFEL